MTEISVAEFLEARLSDPVGRGRTDCDGSGEYAGCWAWSEWHEGVIAAQRVILADYLKAVEDSRPSKVAYALGRKDAGEDVADLIFGVCEEVGDGEQREMLHNLAVMARNIASQAPQATSDATSGVPGHPEVSESRQAVRKRYPHAHACVTCSPDGRQPGPGCINCRQTGWDQTPCQAEGHKPQCPHDCCDPNTQEVSEAVRSPQEPCECSCYKHSRLLGLLRHRPDCTKTGDTP